jgi:hypothetical protein
MEIDTHKDSKLCLYPVKDSSCTQFLTLSLCTSSSTLHFLLIVYGAKVKQVFHQ